MRISDLFLTQILGILFGVHLSLVCAAWYLLSYLLAVEGKVKLIGGSFKINDDIVFKSAYIRVSLSELGHFKLVLQIFTALLSVWLIVLPSWFINRSVARQSVPAHAPHQVD